MATMKYVLDKKSRKELCCRLPRLLVEGKIAAAERLLGKYGTRTDTPVLQVCRIMFTESIGDEVEVTRLLEESPQILEGCRLPGPAENRDSFLRLFAFYVTRDQLRKARGILGLGRSHGLKEIDYGMLWVSYCERADLTAEGVESLRSYFRGKRKLRGAEVAILRRRYPRITRSPEFELVLGRERREGRRS